MLRIASGVGTYTSGIVRGLIRINLPIVEWNSMELGVECQNQDQKVNQDFHHGQA
jgi:hypothetical protein